jgi:very-short-patch-repair endonuclease
MNIPKNPHVVYKESGWLGQSDWVGVKNKSVFLGELIIKDYLDKNNLKYKNNASIVGCKYKYPLKFDFILEKENICIEYDGIQHFNPVSYWGGEKRLNDSKKRDETKNKFCEDNNIKMIRIPYWLKNEEIYEILNKELLTN